MWSEEEIVNGMHNRRLALNRKLTPKDLKLTEWIYLVYIQYELPLRAEVVLFSLFLISTYVTTLWIIHPITMFGLYVSLMISGLVSFYVWSWIYTQIIALFLTLFMIPIALFFFIVFVLNTFLFHVII